MSAEQDSPLISGAEQPQNVSSPVEPTAEMQQALTALLKLAGMEPSTSPVGSEEVAQAVERLKMLITQLKSAPAPPESAPGLTLAEGGSLAASNILIAGQLGIVVHQLRQSLSKLGASVAIAQDMDEAIAEYKNQDYNVVILDLFMPTEREGMIVLDEIRRTAQLCNIQTHIVVLAPPTRDIHLPELCRAHGAALFLEKADGWQQHIIQYVSGGDFVP